MSLIVLSMFMEQNISDVAKLARVNADGVNVKDLDDDQ